MKKMASFLTGTAMLLTSLTGFPVIAEDTAPDISVSQEETAETPAEWAIEDSTEPFAGQPDDSYAGGPMTAVVKRNLSGDAQSWTPAYLNEQMGIDTVEQIWYLFRDKETGRAYLSLYLNDQSSAAYYQTGMALMDTGLFYSVSASLEGESSPGEETEWVTEVPDATDLSDPTEPTDAAEATPSEPLHTLEGKPLTAEQAEEILTRRAGSWQEIDGVYYFTVSNKYLTSDYTFDPYIPRVGTFDRTELVRALITLHPDAKFAVNIQLWNDENDSQTIYAYTERTHLYEHGITAEVTDYRTLYTILTADELENFPASDKAGYFIWLAEKPEGILFRCMEQLDTRTGYKEYLEKVQNGDYENYVLQNGVYWSAMPYPDEIVAEYVASEGTCDRVKLLAALAEVYPDAKFAVTISGGYNSDDTPPYLSELERERFAENGIELLANPDRSRYGYPRYALLTAEQVKAFPGDESFGYMLGLAPVCWADGTLEDTTDITPTDPIDLVLGDANTDFSVDIMDVIYLNRYLLGGITLTYAQKRNCDTNDDGKLDETDSLNILKYVVELTDTVG